MGIYATDGAPQEGRFVWWNATAGPGLQWILLWIAMGYYAIQIVKWVYREYFGPGGVFDRWDEQ